MVAAPPSSQAAGDRPIIFMLDDQANPGRPIEAVTLSVRPEALTRQDSSRAAVQQTLGGAWVDSFGIGVPTITINGHTGWRRDVGTSQSTGGEDGIDRFLRLRDTVFAQWHARRETATRSGQDPNLVQLVFVDGLDNFVADVIPQSFVLQRSRSRPLLMQYQIAMTVIGENVGGFSQAQRTKPVNADVLRALGADSLADSIASLEAKARDVTAYIGSEIGTPMKQFMVLTTAVFKRVQSAVATAEGPASALIAVAGDASRAGANVARTISLVSGLPGRAIARMSQVAAAYTNVLCLLRNAIRSPLQFDDYDSLYGSSNCSSTAGGRALSTYADVNTFAAILPPPRVSDFSMTTTAQSSMRTLARSDVVLAPMSKTSVISAMRTVNLGLEVA